MSKIGREVTLLSGVGAASLVIGYLDGAGYWFSPYWLSLLATLSLGLVIWRAIVIRAWLSILWHEADLAVVWFGWAAGFLGLAGNMLYLKRISTFAAGVWMWATALSMLVLIACVASRAGRRKSPGPYCPRCNYHLVGAREHRCPECGRPFTLEELQITEADLKPPPSPHRLEP